MLRALFVSAIMAFGLWQSLRGPFYGLLFYLWLAYFRPESWVWFDFVTSLNLSLIVGVGVVAWTVLSGRRLPRGSGPVLMMLFVALSLLSTLLSPAFVYSWHSWQEFAKAVVIGVLIVVLVDDEGRLRLTLVIITLSLVFEAAKQCWLQLGMHAGGQNISEHPGVGDTNCGAAGRLMRGPSMIALARSPSGRKERIRYRCLGIGWRYRAIITCSRGGFPGCGFL